MNNTLDDAAKLEKLESDNAVMLEALKLIREWALPASFVRRVAIDALRQLEEYD
jgi:hypothetical protein